MVGLVARGKGVLRYIIVGGKIWDASVRLLSGKGKVTVWAGKRR